MKAFMVAATAGMTGGMMWQSTSSPAAAPSPAACAPLARPPVLSPSEFRSFPLINAYDESPDSKVLRFALPEGDDLLGMELSSCVVFKYTGKDGEEVVRPYTPISRLHQLGYFEVLVKNYKNSKMGSHLHALKIGQSIEVKGPYVKFQYKEGKYKQIGCIAGGSGITPMFQTIRTVIKEKNPPEVSLLYANRRKEDMLLGCEMNELMETNPSFSPHYILSQPTKSWMGGIGHVTKDQVQAFMPAPTRSNDSIILVSGPPKFMEHVCGDKNFKTSPPTQGELSGLLKDMGYSSKMVFKF
jgi:cytochrome-b5 reductase